MEIKDYLHLYIGSQVSVTNTKGRYTTLLDYEFLTRFCDDEDDIFMNDPKPILRKISSITEEEAAKCDELSGGIFTTYTGRAEETRYLLAKSFDLFGLIENNLAIDLETIKQ